MWRKMHELFWRGKPEEAKREIASYGRMCYREGEEGRIEVAKTRIEELAQENERLRQELLDRRVAEMDRLENLTNRAEAAEARCTALKKAARQVIKASPKCVGKDLLLALAELDTALAPRAEAKEEKYE